MGLSEVTRTTSLQETKQPKYKKHFRLKNETGY